MSLGFATAVALCLLTAPTPSSAAPGDPDPDLGGFGTDGRIQALGLGANAMLIDDQGRLVLAGTLANTFFVQRRSGPRFLTTETVSVIINSAQTSAVARAVAIAPDGKIVVAGSVEFPGLAYDFAVVRLNPDLTLDETFSGDGRQTSDFDDREDQAYGVAVTTLCGPAPRGCDHRITVVGSAVIAGTIYTDSDFAVERFNEDGTLDASFADNGKWTYDFDNGGDEGHGVAIQDDGKILVAGFARIGFFVFQHFALARLNLNGSLDLTFGGSGVVVNEFRGWDEATSIALAPDGRIVLAGVTGGSCGDISLMRFLTSGAPDTTFGGDGRITTPLSSAGIANAVVVQPDGKVVVAGGSLCPPDPGEFVLIRYNLDGSLDGTFDTEGLVFTSFGTAATPRALALQPDGMLIAAGGSRAARYRWDGSLDSGGSMSLAFDPGHTRSEATALAVGTDGKLVSAGKVLLGDYQMALARFEAYYRDGLDLTFGTDSPKRGRTLYGLGGFHEEVRALALQPDGKAVVAGQMFNPLPVPNLNFLVGRVNADGTPDTGCDGDGRNAEDFGSSGNDTANAVALGPDDRIYLAGTVQGPTDNDFGLVRFDTLCQVDSVSATTPALYKFRFDLGGDEILGGMLLQASGLPVLAGVSGSEIVLVRVRVSRFGIVSFDPAFGLNGRASLDVGTSEVVTGLAQQADGKLIVSGRVDRAGSDFLVARFTADGQLDTTFGTGGVAFADFNASDTAHALAVRGDGTIAVAGHTNTPEGDRFAVAQFTQSGSADAGFNGNGQATLRLGAAGEDVAQAVTFVGLDRLVVGGYSTVFGIRQFALAAFETTQQPDADGDGIGDVPDNCPTIANAGQANFDGDMNGDVCDRCETVVDAGTDTDADGLDDACDTCTTLANPPLAGSPTANRSFISHQRDDDTDGRGNRCDFDYNNAGLVLTASDFNDMKFSLLPSAGLLTQSSCGATAGNPPAGEGGSGAAQRCGEFDHDEIGAVITAPDFNLSKAAVAAGGVINTNFPKCSQCTQGTGWSNVLGPGARLGRPVCQSAVAGACIYAP